MKTKLKKITVMLLIVTTMAALFALKTNALTLNYSGGSSSNDTGATATTSGFTISYIEASENICGYRFSIVTTAGTPRSGTKAVNVYLSNLDEGADAYSSGQRFIVSSGSVANKKQLANGKQVKSSKTTQSCDYKSGSCGFYSTLPQAPSSVGTWIKKTTNNYQNLQRIYVLCGSNLSNASENDYVLIEPIFLVKLAGTKTAATATELAVYGAAVSGGDQYKGTDGKLYNAGSGTLWNLSNYINREFPNALYVSAKTSVYPAVTIISSGKYTYKQIIGNGYGCSVLTVKNVVTIKKVKIAYHPNGGTATKAGLNPSGFLTIDDVVYFDTLTHGTKDDPYNASTFGLTRNGYQFAGWKVKSTGKILDEDTEYESTVYAQHNDSTKTTANTTSVTCYLYAQWTPNTVGIAYHPNGGTATKAGLNPSGFLTLDDEVYFDTLKHGTKDDPYNASTFGMTREGYQFVGWKVKSTKKILDEDTEYASTIYAHHNDSSKTTANTISVHCYLYAVWEEIPQSADSDKLILVPIEPNAPYRLSTNVVTSYWIVNCGDSDMLPENNVSVRMTVYDNDRIVYTAAKDNIVVPANDKNLIYFKWDAPTSVTAEALTISCYTIIDSQEEESVSTEYEITPHTICSTPDTQYEREAPSGFFIPTVPEAKSGYAKWWEYRYENNAFVKKEYSLGMNDSDIATISSESNDKLKNSSLIKSGYPFSTSFTNTISSVEGYLFPDGSAYTDAQYINVKFPEFGYKSGDGFCRTLFSDGIWKFRQNGSYGNVHFIPLYFPDTEYFVSFEKSDLWTPAGMITAEIISNPLTINGNAYMDWYIQH